MDEFKFKSVWTEVPDRNTGKTKLVPKQFQNQQTGKIKECLIVSRLPYSIIVAVKPFKILDEAQVIITNRDMFGIEQTLECLPAMSFSSKGTTPENAAKQALLKRTGYKAGTMLELGYFYPDPSHSDIKAYVFLAEECVLTGSKPPNVSWSSIKRLKETIAKGEIKDMATICALIVALAKLSRPPKDND